MDQTEEPGSQMIEFLKQNRRVRFNEEHLNSLLDNLSFSYPIVFFFLSENNKVLSVERYRNSFIDRNVENFTEEDLYYITEGIKNQIILGFDDFFFVMHKFFTTKLLEYKPIQSLFLFLLNRFNYKMREIVMTSEETFFRRDLDLDFKIQILVKFLESNNNNFLEFLKSHRIEIDSKTLIGINAFFIKWYEKLPDDKKVINII